MLAFGVSDELPAIPGLAERWGRSVLHCPYCHGYEFSGQRLGVLYVSPASVQQAMLIAEWGQTTLYREVAGSPGHLRTVAMAPWHDASAAMGLGATAPAAL